LFLGTGRLVYVQGLRTAVAESDSFACAGSPDPLLLAAVLRGPQHLRGLCSRCDDRRADRCLLSFWRSRLWVIVSFFSVFCNINNILTSLERAMTILDWRVWQLTSLHNITIANSESWFKCQKDVRQHHMFGCSSPWADELGWALLATALWLRVCLGLVPACPSCVEPSASTGVTATSFGANLGETLSWLMGECLSGVCVGLTGCWVWGDTAAELTGCWLAELTGPWLTHDLPDLVVRGKDRGEGDKETGRVPLSEGPAGVSPAVSRGW